MQVCFFVAMSTLVLYTAASGIDAAQRLQFEVASIRPHKGPVAVSGLGISGPRVGEIAVDLMDLVTDAYNVRYEQVSGGPDWGKGAARWGIQAKVPGERQPSRDEVRQMLQSLLADRFKLTGVDPR